MRRVTSVDVICSKQGDGQPGTYTLELTLDRPPTLGRPPTLTERGRCTQGLQQQFDELLLSGSGRRLHLANPSARRVSSSSRRAAGEWRPTGTVGLRSNRSGRPLDRGASCSWYSARSGSPGDQALTLLAAFAADSRRPEL